MSQSLAATIAANLQIVQHALSGSEPQTERIVLHSGGLHPAPDLRCQRGRGEKNYNLWAYVCCVAPVRNEGTGMAPYSTPCPLDGHPKWHFIMFCRPYGHPRGHFHSVFLGALSALPLCLRLGLTGPLIVSSHDCQIHLLRTAKCSGDSIFTK